MDTCIAAVFKTRRRSGFNTLSAHRCLPMRVDFVIKGALTPAQVATANAVLDNPPEAKPGHHQGGALHWDPVFREVCSHFSVVAVVDCADAASLPRSATGCAQMMDNPRVSPVLEDLIGAHNWGNYYGSGQEDLPSFRLDHLNVHLHVKQGHKAEGLHGGNFSSHAGGSQFFRYHDGQFYVRICRRLDYRDSFLVFASFVRDMHLVDQSQNGLLVVAYELQDTVANNGGFGCIPGTHKGNVDLPEEWRDPTNGGPPNLRRVPAEAGDAIVFTEAVGSL